MLGALNEPENNIIIQMIISFDVGQSDSVSVKPPSVSSSLSSMTSSSSSSSSSSFHWSLPTTSCFSWTSNCEREKGGREREREGEREGGGGGERVGWEGREGRVTMYSFTWYDLNNYKHTLTSLEKTTSMYESDTRQTVYRRQPGLSGAGMWSSVYSRQTDPFMTNQCLLCLPSAHLWTPRSSEEVWSSLSSSYLPHRATNIPAFPTQESKRSIQILWESWAGFLNLRKSILVPAQANPVLRIHVDLRGRAILQLRTRWYGQLAQCHNYRHSRQGRTVHGLGDFSCQ